MLLLNIVLMALSVLLNEVIGNCVVVVVVVIVLVRSEVFLRSS